MGRPRKVAGQTPTDKRILAAAEEAFAEYGRDGVSLSQIAADVGIRAPSLLYHFPTKQALYTAVIGHVFADLQEAVLENMSVEETLFEQVTRTSEALGTLVATRQTFLRLVVRELLSSKGEESPAIKGLELLVDALAGLLEQRGAGAPGVPVPDAVRQLIYGFLLRGAAAGAEFDTKEVIASTQAMAYRLLLPEHT